MSEEREIKEDLKINRFKLEDEADTQPSLFYHYSEHASEAREVRDKAKAKLKETEGRISLDYWSSRKVMEAKLSISTVSASVDIDPEVMDAREKFLNAESAYNKAASAEESMQQRKSMLGYLVQLYTMQYYSQPRGAKGSEEQAGDEMRKNLNRDKE